MQPREQKEYSNPPKKQQGANPCGRMPPQPLNLQRMQSFLIAVSAQRAEELHSRIMRWFRMILDSRNFKKMKSLRAALPTVA